MEIKQIIADVLPDNCRKCQFHRIFSRIAHDCTAKPKTITYERDGDLSRPIWCPLQVEEECMWSGNYGGEDENGDAIFITKKTSCSDVHIQTVNIPDYKYCPNCGKRIKYAGSEE